MELRSGKSDGRGWYPQESHLLPIGFPTPSVDISTVFPTIPAISICAQVSAFGRVAAEAGVVALLALMNAWSAYRTWQDERPAILNTASGRGAARLCCDAVEAKRVRALSISEVKYGNHSRPRAAAPLHRHWH